MARVADYCARKKNALTAWFDRWAYAHPNLLPFLLGVSATLTLPPFYLFPLVIAAYGGLYALLVRAQSMKSAAKTGFFWGWGFYMSGLYWFVIALMTDPEKFAWLIPPALFALTAVIALYTTLFATLFYIIQVKLRSSVLRSVLAFAILWTMIEYARGHMFGGFPWNLGGYVFAASDASIQLASITGAYGLTFITIFLGAIVVAHKHAAKICWSVLLVTIAWGAYRAETAPREFVPNVRLRLVQAGIQQQHKWDPALQMAGLRKHQMLTRAPGIERITHIIWPETAVPYILEKGSGLAMQLGFSLFPGQHLITGALRAEGDNITNSIAVVNHQGDIVGHYDKHKLVPFGEFLPLRWLIPDALETPVGMQDLAAGKGLETLEWPGLPPVSPLICYEVIFPGEAARRDKKPQWLLSVTNDAWFGESTAPYQHLAMARMRAVEEGLPMVRVANTGITAVYDAYGREIARIPLNEKSYIDVGLPKPAK